MKLELVEVEIFTHFEEKIRNDLFVVDRHECRLMTLLFQGSMYLMALMLREMPVIIFSMTGTEIPLHPPTNALPTIIFRGLESHKPLAVESPGLTKSAEAVKRSPN